MTCHDRNFRYVVTAIGHDVLFLLSVSPAAAQEEVKPGRIVSVNQR